MIYFIRAKHSGSIKIGYTGNNPEIRLGQLQTASPEPLELIGCVEGGVEKERFLHQELASERVHGEWFFGPSTCRVLAIVLANKKPDETAPYWLPIHSMIANRYDRNGAITCVIVCPCCGSDGGVSLKERSDSCPGFPGPRYVSPCGSSWELAHIDETQGLRMFAGLYVRADCREESAVNEWEAKLRHGLQPVSPGSPDKAASPAAAALGANADE